MWQYIVKILFTAVIVVAIAECAKRWTLLGAVIASLPLTSILAMIWLYIDTRSMEKVSSLSTGIFWVVLPSLVFFILFPMLTKMGWNFWVSLLGASCVTAVCYVGYLQVLAKLGIEFK